MCCRSAFVGFSILAGVLGTGCERGGTPSALPPDAPNVLLVTLDTTRADRLGCYGHAAAQTPVLDGLADGGVRFDHAFCQVPLTLPSHASLLTGAFPPTTGLRINSGGVLGPELPTLAEQFQQRGYRTGAFVAAWVVNASFGLNRGFDEYDDDLGPDPGGGPARERTAERVCDAALAWLDREPQRPFFAWVHFYDPHFPYAPPAPYREQLTDPYDGEIAFVDAQFGRLLAWLAESDCRARTLIVVVGDHGEAFGEHGEIEHGVFLYDATVRVPLLIAYPPRCPARTVVAAGVRVVDVAPTIVDLLGWKVPEPWQGQTLRTAWESPAFAGHPAYVESEYPRTAFGYAPLRAFTTAQWKYVDAPRPELYDRRADPNELHNLVEQHADVAEDLRNQLDEALAAMPEHAAGVVQLTPDQDRVLRSLGYVGGPSPASRDDRSRRDPKDMAKVIRAARHAQLLLGEQHYAEVVQILEPLVAQSPESDELFAALGQAHLKLGRFPAAEAALRKSLRTVPTDAQSLCYLGDALHAQQRIDEAVTCYEQAIAALRDFALPHNRLGAICLRQGRLDAAQEHFQRCLELEPNSPNALTNAASVLRQMHRPEEALRLLERALANGPQYVPAHILRARTLVGARRSAEALAALRSACTTLPENVPLKSELAQVLLMSPPTPGVAQEATTLARACCAAEPEVAEHFELLARALAAGADRAGAIAAAEQAIRLARRQGNGALAERVAQWLQVQAGQPPR